MLHVLLRFAAAWPARLPPFVAMILQLGRKKSGAAICNQYVNYIGEIEDPFRQPTDKEAQLKSCFSKAFTTSGCCIMERRHMHTGGGMLDHRGASAWSLPMLFPLFFFPPYFMRIIPTCFFF